MVHPVSCFYHLPHIFSTLYISTHISTDHLSYCLSTWMGFFPESASHSTESGSGVDEVFGDQQTPGDDAQTTSSPAADTQLETSKFRLSGFLIKPTLIMPGLQDLSKSKVTPPLVMLSIPQLWSQQVQLKSLPYSDSSWKYWGLEIRLDTYDIKIEPYVFHVSPASFEVSSVTSFFKKT